MLQTYPESPDPATAPVVNEPLTSPWPQFSEEEIAAATAPLRTGKINYWTGAEGREFESEFARFFGAKHAVAVANGSVAIELAAIALDLRPGDEVVVTPRTFLASATSLILRGLIPVFAEVDRDSGNITPESAEQVITERTRALLCVHLGGWPCEMGGFRQLADAHNLSIIEDCAQSHGAKIDGRFLGTFGEISAWSFCQDKIMTTGGEGGMVTCDDQDMWSKVWSYKDHGKSWEAVYNRQHPVGFRWLHESVGTNWRLTESQSAIGRVQLRKLPEWVSARRENALLLAAELKRHGCVRVPMPAQGVEGAFYRLYAYVRPESLKAGWDRNRLMTAITEAGVPCFSGTCSEIYLEKALADLPTLPSERLPVAKELGETSLCFLVHPTLTVNQIGRQCDVIGQVLKEATRPATF